MVTGKIRNSPSKEEKEEEEGDRRTRVTHSLVVQSDPDDPSTLKWHIICLDCTVVLGLSTVYATSVQHMPPGLHCKPQPPR